MTDEGTNARRFLNAFADIEAELARQQNKRINGEGYTKFWELVESSDELIPKQKEALKLLLVCTQSG